MALLDVSLVIAIMGFLILLVWSRVMGQTMYDTVMEIKDMIDEIKNGS